MSGEWFAQPQEHADEPGLRFECTMCGNCCTGPPGYVLVSEREIRDMAGGLGIEAGEFVDRYTHATALGRSLKERPTEFGQDCVFLDREKIPGKAVCGVYEHRPTQCRTWPFWKGNLRTPNAWKQAKRVCPGMDKGRLYPPEQIRILRDQDES